MLCYVFAYFSVFCVFWCAVGNCVFVWCIFVCLVYVLCLFHDFSDSPESVIPFSYASRLSYLDLPIVCTTIPIAVLLLTDLAFPGLAVVCFPAGGLLVLPHQIALADPERALIGKNRGELRFGQGLELFG